MDDFKNNEILEQQSPVQEKYTPCATTDLAQGVVLPHFHDAIEIIFTTAGSGTAVCNGEKYRHTAGSVFFAAKNEIHYFTDRSDDIKGLVVDIEPQILFGNASIFRDSIPLSHMWQDPAMEHPLWDIVNFMCRNIKNRQCLFKQDTQTALVSALLTLLADCVELEKATQSNATITQILNYCQEHFAEPLSLEILSKELHLSLSHISRIFSHKLRISFSDYLNSLRLNEAIRIMNTSKVTVTKVAALAGFPTIRTFNRVFMEKYGITPSQYRKTNKK